MAASKLLCLVSTFAVLSQFGVNGCIYPTGLGEGVNDIDPSTLTSLPSDGIFPANIFTIVPYLGEYETPIQFRLIQLSNMAIFSSMAAFDDTSLDHFGRQTESESRRRCNDADYFDIHRRVTLAYTLYFTLTQFIPESQDDLAGVLGSFGLSTDICDSYDCSDTSSPWGLGYTLVQESKKFADYDGWNSDGSLSRDYNKIPYQDFRDEKDNKYIPKNDPWTLSNKDNWQPLLESDEKGFLFFQEHVVPHIGFTGKSIFLGDDEICAHKADKPDYDYDDEMQLALDRLAILNDTTKMEIEFFDSKLTSIVPLMVQYYARQGVSLDSFEFIAIDSIVISVLYEAVMVVWKEKVNFDGVRPPSIIHHEYDGQYVTSYAGRSADGESYGTQTFLANDWEPYIRTMPHAEYPSGSSCVCQAFQVAIEQYTGNDDVTSTLGGPLIYQADPFTSKLEPLSTPQNTVVMAFSSWSEVAQRCGQSRLNGGMHFTASVPAGEQLCGDIGGIVATSFENIMNGITPDYVVDINDETIANRDC